MKSHRTCLDSDSKESASVQEDPLKNGMATHSSILAWRFPWTQEPDQLQSLGHKELDTTNTFIFILLSMPSLSFIHIVGWNPCDWISFCKAE